MFIFILFPLHCQWSRERNAGPHQGFRIDLYFLFFEMHNQDISQRVAELESQLSKVQDEFNRCTAQKTVLAEEVHRLDGMERRAIEELMVSEENSLHMAFEYGQRTDDTDSLSALVQVLRTYAAQEQLRLLEAEKELDTFREGVAREVHMIHSTTSELRQRLAEHRTELTASEQQSKRQRSEILRLQQERLELEARTESSLLNHARELFRVVA